MRRTPTKEATRATTPPLMTLAPLPLGGALGPGEAVEAGALVGGLVGALDGEAGAGTGVSSAGAEAGAGSEAGATVGGGGGLASLALPKVVGIRTWSTWRMLKSKLMREMLVTRVALEKCRHGSVVRRVQSLQFIEAKELKKNVVAKNIAKIGVRVTVLEGRENVIGHRRKCQGVPGVDLVCDFGGRQELIENREAGKSVQQCP
ncbi:hypothetical protein R1sor_021634 [Riccia sorocarpa]|uniref:Uncharacterized protein n=1 Tax=Riccia sorocarpa TaxID=122646 RepID=A0ABD3GHM6_9MARC